MAAVLATTQAAAARPTCSAAGRQQPLRSSPAAAAPSRSHRTAAAPQLLRQRAAGPPPVRSLSDDEVASLQAVQELDALIDVLLGKKNPQDLAQAVAENIMSFDQRFWMRLATRADAAADDEAKQQLAALAKVVMQLVDGMVKRTNEQLGESTSLLQDVLKAAADPATGEWQLPLPADKLEAMRGVMAANAARLDEGLLASAYSWMRKAAEDKMDGMVALLQKVLQVYAQVQLGGSSAQQQQQQGGSASDALLNDLLAADEATWGAVIRQRAKEAEISEVAFMEALQRRMEGVVLGLPSGSYAQRVQAEYLKELEERARGEFAEVAKAA